MTLTHENSKRFEGVKHEWLLLRDLRAHPQVQRTLNLRWVNDLAVNLDPDKFGEISVAKVVGETYYHVFDGQHRIEAARKAWGDEQRIPCAIYNHCPLERQAKIFLGQNNRLPLKALDRWLQRVTANEEKVVAIEKVLDDHKLRTNKSRGVGVVQAVGALERVFDRYGRDSLSRTLDIIGKAWGRDPDAYDSLHLKGISFLVYKFNGEMADEELIRKLARGEGPMRMIGQARDYAAATGVSVERAMSEKLLAIYNKGRTTKRLELR